jgi:type I restriction enzyme S subunit
MKKGWQTKTLGEVLEKTETVNPLQSPNTEFDYIDVSSVSNTTFEIEETQRLKGKDAPSRARKLVRTNDIIFATIRPTLQRIAVVPEHLDKQVCSTGYFVLRPKQGINHRFVFYSLFTENFIGQMESLQKGASYPAVTDGDVRAQEIPLPPLPEQQRIVGLLDKAFEGLATAKANAEKNLQNARALFESHLQSVFTQRGLGWMEKKLKSITTKIGSGATPRGGGESYKDEGISLIRSLNVHDLGFKYAKLAFLDDAQADELSNVEVQTRDVLLNITGASIARCAIVPEDVLPARVNQHVSIIRPIAEKLDADFLHYLLISKPYKDQLLKTGEEGGSTRQAITKAQIQEFTVEYPATLKEQIAIVAKLNAMLAETQRLAAIYSRKLAALEALKKSLLHQAFTGAL